MNWNASDMAGYRIEAGDGAIGSVADLLFDDQEWTVRWLVIDTGGWLSGRQVLLPPSCIERRDPVARRLHVRLTRAQVEESPSLDTDAPVSRQKEAEIYAHYAWPPYWVGGLGYAGTGHTLGNRATYRPIVPPLNEAGAPTESHAAPVHARMPEQQQRPKDRGDPHLRSTGHVTGLSIYAADGSIGHVEDFVIGDEDWAVRYMIVDTVNWWPGKKVLVSPGWIVDISWVDRNVTVELTREQVRSSPEYDPGQSVERSYEDLLHAHYRLPPYRL